ncbi:related to MET12 - methylenetetrahydrofolate reductase [Moesziomyces antarcticus]|nr:related to MET12 - methylenetetrahydrofolate reductase [Moesziomyces antarcticus]
MAASSSNSTPGAHAAAAPNPAHITAKIQQANARDAPFWSFEFFPPKTTQGLANLYSRIARMRANLDPSWIHVTWGAGGTTVEKSLELAGRIQKGRLDPATPLLSPNGQNGSEAGEEWQHESADACDVCLHLTCTNVQKASLDETLLAAKRLGIRNILALRGDPPRGEEYWVAADERFQHATDLVRYIRDSHGDHFCIGVAGYPEGHADYVDRDVQRDLAFLKQKQDAGAQYIVTQLFYDVDRFLAWYKDARALGITIPILPGIMPIQNYQSFRRMTNLCKVQIPPLVLEALEPIKADDAAVKEYGVALSIHMIGRIFLESDVRGFHLCSLNLEKSIERILDGLGWKTDVGALGEADVRLSVVPAHLHLERTKNQMLSDRTGANTPRDFKVTTQEALKRTLARTSSSYQVPETTTWDEFPNGRYGDSRSPAFGEMDGYGVSLKVPAADALRIWGHPVTLSDISTIFASYLEEKIACIPWCDAPLMNETLQIRDHLLALNRLGATRDAGKGWWSVGSQPAIDGAPSTDPVVGFGPAGGFIFQKAFVELFMSGSDKDALVEAIDAMGPHAQYTYFAGNTRGDFVSNLAEGEANTVTWAVFPGKEIVQSTIIERDSFEAWREEAFGIWNEWAMLFLKTSASRQLIDSITNDRWLMTIVHHDYKDAQALWKFLAQ